MEHERKDIFKIQKNYKIRKFSMTENSSNLKDPDLFPLLDLQELMLCGTDFSRNKKKQVRKKSYKKSFEKNRKESRTCQAMDVESEEYGVNLCEIKKNESESNLCDSSLITDDTKSNKSGGKQSLTLKKIEESINDDKFSENLTKNNLILSVTNFSSSFICQGKNEVTKSENTPCPASKSNLVIPNFFQDRLCQKKADTPKKIINVHFNCNILDSETRDLYFLPIPSNKISSFKYSEINSSDNFNEDIFFKFD